MIECDYIELKMALIRHLFSKSKYVPIKIFKYEGHEFPWREKCDNTGEKIGEGASISLFRSSNSASAVPPVRKIWKIVIRNAGNIGLPSRLGRDGIVRSREPVVKLLPRDLSFSS